MSGQNKKKSVADNLSKLLQQDIIVYTPRKVKSTPTSSTPLTRQTSIKHPLQLAKTPKQTLTTLLQTKEKETPLFANLSKTTKPKQTSTKQQKQEILPENKILMRSLRSELSLAKEQNNRRRIKQLEHLLSLFGKPIIKPFQVVQRGN